MTVYFLPADAFCIEISGRDATTVANNLNTNNIAKLEVGHCLESFITNVRGWVVAHVMVLRLADKVLLVGRHSATEHVCNHIDRYIIREDARVSLRTDLSVILVSDPQGQWPDGTISQRPGEDRQTGCVGELTLRAYQGWEFDAPFSGCNTILLLADVPFGQLRTALNGVELSEGDAELLELLRIKQRWPLESLEITEKTIPQELDRDAQAVSFTKGCYLGQETIARLDALGQLQKKLCLVEFELTASSAPAVGSRLFSGDQDVGALTSVAVEGQRGYGLAMLKRGAFEVGTALKLIDHEAGELEARVVEPQ